MSYQQKRKERIQRLIKEAIHRVEKDITTGKLSEDTKGIKIGVTDLATVDANKLAQLANKSTINVVKQVKEAEEELGENPGKETGPDKGKSISKENLPTPQEEAIANVKTWAINLGLKIGEGEKTPGNTIRFGYYEPVGDHYIAIFIYPTGLIHISGHVIQDFEDFESIVKWHKEK